MKESWVQAGVHGIFLAGDEVFSEAIIEFSHVLVAEHKERSTVFQIVRVIR